MDDLIKSLKAQLYDRVTSPLLSSFLIAWVVWNHRLFVVLLSSDLKVQERFDYVDNVLFPTWREVVGRGFTWPLLSALVLLLAYPIPGRWVYKRVRLEQTRLKTIQQEFDDKTPITLEEARGLRSAIQKAEQEHDAQSKLIAELRATIDQQETQLKYFEAGGSGQPLAPSLNMRQRNILVAVARFPGLNLDFYQQKSTADPVLVAHEVDRLVDLGFVSESGDRRLAITAKGREFLVENEPNFSNKYKEPTFENIEID